MLGLSTAMTFGGVPGTPELCCDGNWGLKHDSVSAHSSLETHKFIAFIKAKYYLWVKAADQYFRFMLKQQMHVPVFTKACNSDADNTQADEIWNTYSQKLQLAPATSTLHSSTIFATIGNTSVTF